MLGEEDERYPEEDEEHFAHSGMNPLPSNESEVNEQEHTEDGSEFAQTEDLNMTEENADDGAFEADDAEADDDDEDIQIVLEHENPNEQNQQSSSQRSNHRTSPISSIGNGKNMTMRNNLISIQTGKNQKPGSNKSNQMKDSIINLDIDTLEEKPWRKQGVEISDYFNYGFNEDTWKQYCSKQIQLRLEQNMQAKIKVYERQKSVVDLPPELLALSGHSDSSQGQSSSSSRNDKNRQNSRRGPTSGGKSSSSRTSHDHRRRMREQDDSVIQVVGSGEGSEGQPSYDDDYPHSNPDSDSRDSHYHLQQKSPRGRVPDLEHDFHRGNSAASPFQMMNDQTGQFVMNMNNGLGVGMGARGFPVPTGIPQNFRAGFPNPRQDGRRMPFDDRDNQYHGMFHPDDQGSWQQGMDDPRNSHGRSSNKDDWDNQRSTRSRDDNDANQIDSSSSTSSRAGSGGGGGSSSSSRRRSRERDRDRDRSTSASGSASASSSSSSSSRHSQSRERPSSSSNDPSAGGSGQPSSSSSSSRDSKRRDSSSSSRDLKDDRDREREKDKDKHSSSSSRSSSSGAAGVSAGTTGTNASGTGSSSSGRRDSSSSSRNYASESDPSSGASGSSKRRHSETGSGSGSGSSSSSASKSSRTTDDDDNRSRRRK
eukprot:TRINITY_DN448_c0_g1_i3.p1 TRINITY_DN448_c0_g1~~TRINITY_DN448_c0_g1_i3.p1  ORF type:complete len:650 (+),score=184.02 TRINITY_DN448_c0_g1_i3:23-1972(+)